MDYSQFGHMIPELIVLGIFMVVLLFDVFSSDKSSKKFLTPLTTILFGLGTVAIWLIPATGQEVFSGMFVNNTATNALKSILNIGVFIVFLQSAKWVESDEVAVRKGEFYELILVTLFGMYLMVSGRHFLLFVIGLEAASLPLAALVAFNKKYYESAEAATKYILTAVFSSGVLLMGLSFVYACSNGSLYFNDIAQTFVEGNMSGMMICALAFVIAGIGFKLSLVPFHLWTADVYQGAPTAVTSYLSVISKGSAAFAFFVIFVQAFGQVWADAWEWMLYAVIILTITVGNLFAIRQRNIKRFMAFSSVSQAGYIMLAAVVGTNLGLAAMLYYIIVYIVSNLGAFSVIAMVENQTGRLEIEDYNGLHKTNPRLSFAMTLAMFSLAGIPPFAGFFSKILMFTSVTASNCPALYALVLIALINTIISLYYYLLVVKAMWISPEEPKIENIKGHFADRLALGLCVLGIIFFGIVPFIYQYCYDAVQNLICMVG
ncbi:MAG: NADH-quinone oxidoreductase subunit N [Prevotella sp.]|nr:NADH-quinone oxidoreductase subunit N [Bacteroides sp.]MCM1365949.1 NADH-quinone oxidoreductase subunit N [Prevotella sp.]MCM1436630.1 NADH-quinone oxidoreductase subunit N [Prevotella sp.]